MKKKNKKKNKRLKSSVYVLCAREGVHWPNLPPSSPFSTLDSGYGRPLLHRLNRRLPAEHLSRLWCLEDSEFVSF